jgi:DNA polymerase III delta subunit
MHIFLLHGDDTEKSYERLTKYVEHAKKRAWEIVHIGDKNTRLPQVYVTTSLFVTDKLVIVDDFDFLNKRDLDWLTAEGEKLGGNLVIYHDATLPKTKLKSVPRLDKEEKFELPVLLWKMIDAFRPGNAKQFLQLMHKVLEKHAPELVFGLLAKKVRDMYWVLVDPSSYPFPPWKKSNLQGEAFRFGKEKLEEIIFEMAEIDVRSKTSDFELKDLLDLLAVRELE